MQCSLMFLNHSKKVIVMRAEHVSCCTIQAEIQSKGTDLGKALNSHNLKTYLVYGIDVGNANVDLPKMLGSF